MKAVSFSIIVYILLLLTQPCQDVFAAPPSNNEGSPIAVVRTPQMPDNEEDADICSPFCVCSCCSLTVGYSSALLIKEPEPTISASVKNDLEYKDPAIKNFSDSIWQPPKL